MNKIGLLLRALHEAETDLAEEYRKVAGRDAVEHDVYYLCHTLAKQCDGHADWVRRSAATFDKHLTEPTSVQSGDRVMGRFRHKASELAGRRPESGLLLLRDLRHLYVSAETVNVHWIMLGQVAQALKDHGLLADTSGLHKQTLTQIKWLKTRIKQATPQVLVTGQQEAIEYHAAPAG